MKIIDKNVIYVQKSDIHRLDINAIHIPESIHMKYNKNEKKKMNEFIKFSDLEEIEYFNSIDCIIDYDDIKDKSLEELLYVIADVIKNKDNIGNAFFSLSNKEKAKNLDMYLDWKLECMKILALNDCMVFRAGLVDIELPTENSVKKFVKRICNKKVK